jgi:hypothetical protein
MNPGQEAKYAITMIIPKRADLSQLRRAVETAATKKFGDSAIKMIKLGRLKLPFRDGDEERPEDELYKGKIFFAAKSNQQPRIVDQELKPITDEFEFYSGAKCRISVYAFGYDVNGNKGVAFALNNIQKLGDGERLSGRRPPEEDFMDEVPKDGEDEDDDMFGS